MSPLNGNSSYIFAQKDISNSLFQIQLTAQQTSNTSFVFTVFLYQGGYNNFRNNSCDQTCNATVNFASVNGTKYPTQFV